MEKELRDILKKLIKDELGDMVADEIKEQFKPIQKALNTVIDENRKYHDNVSRQITEDRKDINQTSTDMATSVKQNKIIIDNQNHAEEKLVAAVKEEAEKIPQHTQKAVEKMFDKKPFLTKIRERFIRRG